MRIVSLVPSATETLLALGVAPVACTRFCEQPGIPTVGGTKDPQVDAIVGLSPDLVVVNDEENRMEDAARLVDAGIALHPISPRSVAEVGPGVRALADACSVDVPAPFDPIGWDEWLGRQAVRRGPRRRACTLVWRRPWLAVGAATYGSSVLDLLGYDNVFGAEPERYPEVTLEEVAACAPEMVVLPDEPYPFRGRHVVEVRDALAGASAVLADGRDLFWWGIRTPAAVDRLRVALAGR